VHRQLSLFGTKKSEKEMIVDWNIRGEVGVPWRVVERLRLM
jgi:hypothetical protein